MKACFKVAIKKILQRKRMTSTDKGQNSRELLRTNPMVRISVGLKAHYGRKITMTICKRF